MEKVDNKICGVIFCGVVFCRRIFEDIKGELTFKLSLISLLFGISHYWDYFSIWNQKNYKNNDFKFKKPFKLTK